MPKKTAHLKKYQFTKGTVSGGQKGSHQAALAANRRAVNSPQILAAYRRQGSTGKKA